MDYLIGSIVLLPYTFVPQGFYQCNGQLLSVNANQVLFSLLGTQFGGDGMNNFGLPNLQGAEPHPSIRFYICAEGMYPTRD